MKEITVTFENGGVFNGSANSFTLDNLITYYFAIDKNYRVQVNANTMAIELQEYQNTNGAWYGIDTITQVAVTEIKAEGDVTKDYLEQNYYNKQQTNDQIKDTLQDYYTKQQVDDLIAQGGGGEVTKDYLDQNYYNKAQVDQIAGRFYNKTESDRRYVRKAGDTMTGPLIITNSEGYKTAFEANSWSIFNTEGVAMLNLYNNNVNLYNGGGVYIKQGSTGSASLIRMTVNGFYIYDPDGEWVGSLAQENNYAICALHMFNNSRIAMHTGKPNTTERFLQINGSEFHLYNNVDYGTFHFYGPMVVEDKLTVQQALNVQGQLNANGRTNHRGGVYIYDAWLYQYQNGKCMVQLSNALHLFNGGNLYLHTGAKDTTEKFVSISGNQMSINNPEIGSYGFNVYTNGSFITVTGGISLFLDGMSFDAQGASRIQFQTSLNNIFNVDRYAGAMNSNFYGGSQFISALNIFLERLQSNIKSVAPSFSQVAEVTFNSENFGDGWAAGGGTSRGGGVGRRSVG